jgi:hypothetical protein
MIYSAYDLNSFQPLWIQISNNRNSQFSISVILQDYLLFLFTISTSKAYFEGCGAGVVGTKKVCLLGTRKKLQ